MMTFTVCMKVRFWVSSRRARVGKPGQPLLASNSPKETYLHTTSMFDTRVMGDTAGRIVKKIVPSCCHYKSNKMRCHWSNNCIRKYMVFVKVYGTHSHKRIYLKINKSQFCILKFMVRLLLQWHLFYLICNL